jgi:hypothetical protein
MPRPDALARGSPASFDFVGRMTAVVAMLALSRDGARAMLPAGLELAAQDFMPGERHPLVLVLGRQSDVRPRLLPLGADYLEAILGVPFVQLRERGTPPRGPFCYCPRLFLDRRLPIVVGRLLYHYDKRRALIRMTADSYRIAEPTRGERLLDAQFGAAEAPVELARRARLAVFRCRFRARSRAARGARAETDDSPAVRRRAARGRVRHPGDRGRPLARISHRHELAAARPVGAQLAPEHLTRGPSSTIVAERVRARCRRQLPAPDIITPG